MSLIQFLKTSDDTYPEVSADNPLPTTATIAAGSAVIGHVITDSGSTTAVTGTVTVDTELPAAAALADSTANPITTSVGALNMGFNGSTWDRLQAIIPADSQGQGISHLLVISRDENYNGASWDRVRNNTQNTLLSSAARTVTTSSSDQTNYNARGLHVVLDVTSAGTGSITLSIEAKDTLSGKYYTLLAGVAVTTNSTNVYKVYPGLPATANVSANDIIPRTYRVTVTANNANSITYSVASLLVL